MSTSVLGEWSFRFGGHAVAPDDALHHIVGIGRLKFSDSSKVVGFHDSTILRIAGPHTVLPKHDHYVWNGTYTIRGAGYGTLHIDFHLGDLSAPRDLHDDFDFVMVGPDRLWFISNGPRIFPEDMLVPEVVSAEAIRIPREQPDWVRLETQPQVVSWDMM
jgi:hypothetical protein